MASCFTQLIVLMSQNRQQSDAKAVMRMPDELLDSSDLTVLKQRCTTFLEDAIRNARACPKGVNTKAAEEYLRHLMCQMFTTCTAVRTQVLLAAHWGTTVRIVKGEMQFLVPPENSKTSKNLRGIARGMILLL